MTRQRVLRWIVMLSLMLVFAAAIGGGVDYATSSIKFGQGPSEDGIAVALIDLSIITPEFTNSRAHSD